MQLLDVKLFQNNGALPNSLNFFYACDICDIWMFEYKNTQKMLPFQ